MYAVSLALQPSNYIITMKYIIGIDLGTQSVKAGLVSLDSMLLEKVTSRPCPAGPLQNPELLWAKTKEAVSELMSGGTDVEIAGVGLSGQMHGAVLYDKNDTIIGPVINWQDERGNIPHEAFGGATAVEIMNDAISEDAASELGIDIIASGFMGVTLFHIMRTDPGLFGGISKALLPADFLRRKLAGGGAYTTDPTNAFSTGLFNTKRNRWSGDVLDSLGLPEDILPVISETTAVTCHIDAGVADETGLPAGAPIVCGGGDNQMSMIGSGVCNTLSPVMINIGTSSQFCAVTADYRRIPGLDTRSFINGLFAYVGAGLTGGMAYTWFRNTLEDDIKRLGLSFNSNYGLYRILDDMADEIDHGCDGLEFTPLLRGTRRNPALRASFSGISMNNFSLGHRARSVMEGVIGELLNFYTLCGDVKSESVVGSGNGLVKSAVWRRIATQKFGMPLHVMDFENAVYGAALVAAEGLGLASIQDGRFEACSIVHPEE